MSLTDAERTAIAPYFTNTDRPVFALTVVLLLGAGISANTLIFSLVDTLLLKPLPVRGADRLVRLVELHPTGFVTWDLPFLLGERLSSSGYFEDVFSQGNIDLAFEHNGRAEPPVSSLS